MRTYLNPLVRPTLNSNGKAVNPIVDKKFNQGMKLQSLFDPAETAKISQELNENSMKKRHGKSTSKDPKAVTGVHFS